MEIAFEVEIKHRQWGIIRLENITEIHYQYPSVVGLRIAFESDIEGTGYVYDVEDILEFEAKVQTEEVQF